MAKITDLNQVQSIAATIVEEKCPDLVDKIGLERAVWCLVAIYTTNDYCKGYGQDFNLLQNHDGIDSNGVVSVVSYQNGVSVIVDSHMSRYADRFPLCGYESLYDDLSQIAISIQAAFDRLG